MILSCTQEDRVFPMLYVASYNELEQLHTQVRMYPYMVYVEAN